MQPSILIVEDDVTFSLMLKTWLGRKGFLVESQTSVSDAQKCLDSRSFQLVLSDLRLPDRDGIELLKWLCRYPYGRTSDQIGSIRLYFQTSQPGRIADEDQRNHKST
mgnify:CR=1 FL=1